MEEIRNDGEWSEAEGEAEAGLAEELDTGQDDADADDEDSVHIEWAGFI